MIEGAGTRTQDTRLKRPLQVSVSTDPQAPCEPKSPAIQAGIQEPAKNQAPDALTQALQMIADLSPEQRRALATILTSGQSTDDKLPDRM